MLVTCEWGVNALDITPDEAAVVIVDVLSFSTTVTIACARGATIFPSPWSDERAAALARTEHASLATKDRTSAFSLSPSAVRGIPSGARMVLPSRNGSAIAFAARERGFEAIAVGCFRNAAAVAGWVGGRRAVVIAGGERWPDDSLRFAIEDWLAAGAIIARLPHARSAEAEAAVAAFERLRGDLAGVVRDSMSGRELRDRGWAEDVEVATALDAEEAVPVLEGNAFKLRRS